MFSIQQLKWEILNNKPQSLLLSKYTEKMKVCIHKEEFLRRGPGIFHKRNKLKDI